MFLTSDKLSFGYDSTKNVLGDISFSLAKGETLAIVGASGCGKSTLLRIISGILPSANSNRISGQIMVDGLTPDAYRKSGKLAFMFQEATLMPNLTVRENIALPLRIKGMETTNKVNSLLQTVGLTEYADYLPKQLSGGMKTRVALARSFTTEPELLLLDEPFSALDIAWKSKLYVELEKLKEEFNTTILHVTHDVQEALLLSNKIMVLGRDGSKLKEETISTNISPLQRVNNIGGFIQESLYQNLFPSIQQMIIYDGIRKITGEAEADVVLQKVALWAGTDFEVWNTFRTDILFYREFSNNSEVHELLFNAFEKGRSMAFKCNLIYDVLNFEQISQERIQKVFDYYFANLKEGSSLAYNFYNANPENVFNYLTDKIKNTERYKAQKRWIYLLDMYASSETEKVLNYLNAVAIGEIAELNYPFAKEVARLVKTKIENEKVDSLHTV